MTKSEAIAAVSREQTRLIQLSDAIWDHPQVKYQETFAAGLLSDFLREEGFTVETGVAGIPTAFCASYGSGAPVIGLLAEYDALEGMSQAAEATTRQPVVKGAPGHGCGHNLLGVGAVGAALAVRDYLKGGAKGTLKLFGCPAEEGGSGKTFMAREGVFDGTDIALTWHPGDTNDVACGSNLANCQVLYRFHGKAAHAAICPELGRSALDAVELLNVGVQFLREHMSDKARIHYAITDAGGRSPNVVQPRASVLYMVRSNHVAEAVELQKRVDKIAEGAALMTETSFEKKFIDGLADTVTNHALERVLYQNFQELGVPTHTAEELAFADQLSATYPGSALVPGVGSQYDLDYADQVRALRKEAGHAMNDFLMPLYQGDAFEPGSTDVGDVSWQCPTAQIHVATWPNGCPGHSWQTVSCGRTDIGHKAALHAGKVLAAAAMDLFTQPALLEEAKAEFQRRTVAGYTCPIPANAVPVVAD